MQRRSYNSPAEVHRQLTEVTDKLARKRGGYEEGLGTVSVKNFDFSSLGSESAVVTEYGCGVDEDSRELSLSDMAMLNKESVTSVALL